MDNEQYEFLLGAMVRLDKKMDLLLEVNNIDQMSDEEDGFEKEFDI